MKATAPLFWPFVCFPNYYLSRVLTTPTALGTRVAISRHRTGYIVQKINLETQMKTDTDTSFEFTVLVVEDDDRFRTQLAQYLRDEGFQIVEANSSADACALIRNRKVSLVILDWDLHKANSSPDDPSTGLEILRTCRAVDPLLPVLVMSGAPGLDARTDSLMAGADCFLQKIFSMSLLTVQLRRWMDRQKP